MSANVTYQPEPKICEVGGAGVILPLWDAEQTWDGSARGFIYLLMMGWCFLGVAIVCDVFMEAIEAVTAKRRTIRLKCGHDINVKVWNDTVANLSLMALGSSAPEIMLNVIEIVLRDFFSGDLGPSTIVGSAAFNLMVIIAVCVFVIPEGESRSIKEVEPFLVTASFSIFAYLWMVFCISISSPDVITMPEAFITLAFFPILITVAYLADIGFFTRKKDAADDAATVSLIQSKAMEAGYSLTEEEVKMLSKLNQDHVSWAESRVDASPLRRSSMKEQDLSIGFVSARYCFSPTATKLILMVEKFGSNQDLVENSRVVFEYRTTDGNNMRVEDGDYQACTSRGEIPPGELYGEIVINRKSGLPGSPLAQKKVADDADLLSNLHFFVDITKAEKMPVKEVRRASLLTPGADEEEGKGMPLKVDPYGRRTQVSIANLEGPGKLKMERAEEDVPCPEFGFKAKIKVRRIKGAQGEIACSFFVQDGSAKAGIHYLGVEGELVFGAGVLEKTIEVPVMKKLVGSQKDEFKVGLGALPGRPNFLVEGQTTCNVTIHEQNSAGVESTDKVLKALHTGYDINYVVDNAKDWAQQFIAAFTPNGGDDDDGEASVAEWTMHVFAFPWKIIVAFIPPPSYCGGWCTFYAALLMIGSMTVFIGDLATLLGCVMEINGSITAITIVALGTSLPDMFASKVAAVEDPTADAAIGNVTGSNSVNVFLGLGLPWVIGSVFWASNDKTSEWIYRYPDQHIKYDTPQLVVLSGDLTFSVITFTLCAFLILLSLMYRRKAFQAELGGPIGPKTNTCIFFVLLWVFYVSMASWKVIEGTVSTAKCIQAIAVGLCCMLLGNVLVAGSVHYLWFREEQRRAEMKELIQEIQAFNPNLDDPGRGSITFNGPGARSPRGSLTRLAPLKGGQRLSITHLANADSKKNGFASPRDMQRGSWGRAGGPMLDGRTEELLLAVPKLAEGLRLKLPEAISSLRQHLEALNVVCSALERGMGGGYRPMIMDDASNGNEVPPLRNKVRPGPTISDEASIIGREEQSDVRVTPPTGTSELSCPSDAEMDMASLHTESTVVTKDPSALNDSASRKKLRMASRPSAGGSLNSEKKKPLKRVKKVNNTPLSTPKVSEAYPSEGSTMTSQALASAEASSAEKEKEDVWTSLEQKEQL